MAPEDIKGLRDALGCSARELAGALGIEQETVLAWERGELFPTKRFVGLMDELRRKGPASIPRIKSKKKTAQGSPIELLADPEIWRLLRKVLAHPELRASALQLADGYADPAEPAADRQG